MMTKPAPTNVLPNKQTLSQIIRQLMDEMKITEAKLARRTGIPQPTLHRILSGATHSPRGESLRKLANFFSITISQLIGDDVLSADRIRGAHNPKVRSWSSIPLINLEQIIEWPQISHELHDKTWENWTTTDIEISHSTYGVYVNSEIFSPRFPSNTILVVEPDIAPEDRDYVIVQVTNQKAATVKQLLLDGQDMYLKPLNPDFQTTMYGPEHKILGVVMQARTDTRTLKATDEETI